MTQVAQSILPFILTKRTGTLYKEFGRFLPNSVWTFLLKRGAVFSIVLPMASSWYKKIALPLIFVFAVPVITAFCCCTAEAVAGTENHHGNDCHAHHSDHQHASTSSHGHRECSHPQIIADLANKTLPFLDSLGSVFKTAKKDFAVRKTVDVLSKAYSFSLVETGPPGHLLATVPLYLQISTLRI